MPKKLSPTARKVQAALDALGLVFHVVELPGSTRTAREAAAAIGCLVEQIAKSLIFKGQHTSEPLLVIACGINRVDETKLASLAGEAVGQAEPDFVREHTGFAIGGVPPLGHEKPIRTWIDEDLLKYPTVWAAAGTPRAVFELQPEVLVKVSGGEVVAVK